MSNFLILQIPFPPITFNSEMTLLNLFQTYFIHWYMFRPTAHKIEKMLGVNQSQE